MLILPSWQSTKYHFRATTQKWLFCFYFKNQNGKKIALYKDTKEKELQKSP